MSRDSRIIVGRPTDVGSTASVFAYGDRDDPVRLVVLLADRVLALSSSESNAARSARICLEPRTSWRTRLEHLASALHDTTKRYEEPFIALWDVDALAADYREPWDQERSSLLRRDLFRVVRAAAREGGWLLVRTAPEKAASTALDDLDLERVAGAVGGREAPEETQMFAPECQPIAAWLLARDVLRSTDIPEILRTVGAGANEYLIDLAYSALSTAARDTAGLLTALRAPQELNGHYGRLVFSDCRGPSATALPTATRATLVEAGLLQPTWHDGPWRMPRLARYRIAQLTRVTVDAEVQELHRLEVEDFDIRVSGVDEAVEAHYHAICTGNVELAKQTAVYYGSELAEIAKRLSVQAQEAELDTEKQQLFLAAAALFRHIVENYDDTDAYAWEYLGYNLARAYQAIDPPQATVNSILDAYGKAHRLRPGNPLYHGRYLGFRGQFGQRIVKEALDGIAEYVPDPEALSFFAEAVMTGLWRGGQRAQAREIVAKYGGLLANLAPRVRTEWVR